MNYRVYVIRGSQQSQHSKPSTLPALAQEERANLLSEYYRIHGEGLLSRIARELGVHRSAVTRVFDGTTKVRPNPRITAALWREIQRLTCTKTKRGECDVCPLVSACEKLAAAKERR